MLKRIDDDIKGIFDNCPECDPQSEIECYTCFAHKVLDYQRDADRQEHEVEKRQVAQEIFKEVEKLYKERLAGTQIHPELTWYNWWHDLKAKYGKS